MCLVIQVCFLYKYIFRSFLFTAFVSYVLWIIITSWESLSMKMPLLTTIDLAADFALGIYYHRKVLATSYVCYKSWITLFCEFFFREPILSFFLSLCPIYKFLAINFRQHSNRKVGRSGTPALSTVSWGQAGD